jgi:hypothetical protein
MPAWKDRMNRADELAFQAIIEEFSALRAEVLARVKTRDQLMLVALGIVTK